MKRLIGNDESILHIWTPFGTWLHDAANYGQLEIVRWLLSKGIDLDAYNESNESPPVTLASARGHVEVVKFLIDSDAVLDTSDSVRNPLFATIVGDISDSQTAVAKLLIESGIDTTVRYPNLHNMNALEWAKEWGRTDIVRLLESQ